MQMPLSTMAARATQAQSPGRAPSAGLMPRGVVDPRFPQSEIRSSRSPTPTMQPQIPWRGVSLSARDGQLPAYQFGAAADPAGLNTFAGYQAGLAGGAAFIREISPGAVPRRTPSLLEPQAAQRTARSLDPAIRRTDMQGSPPTSSVPRQVAAVAVAPPAPLVEPAAGMTTVKATASTAPAPSTAAAVPAKAEDVQELKAGCFLKVQDCSCQVTHALGMGSFGAVWAADSPDGTELAVKEIYCNTHSDLMNALFESHLLRVLGSRTISAKSQGDGVQKSASNPCAEFVPMLHASESLCIGVETWRVRLVMSRVPGEPLDLFLEQRRKSYETSAAGGGTGALGWCGLPPLSQQFDEACFFAHELIAQLGPVFEKISESALHRDVNSHNILIDTSNAATDPVPKYGLVDFGLAVDAQCWCEEEGASTPIARPSRIGQDGSSTWHYLDVGGDCRYWPLAAWVQFLAGWRELAVCPSLCAEYQLRLDLHALGITALQLLADLLPLPPEVVSGVREAESLEGALEIGGSVWDDAPPELLVLRIVWERYWGRVTPLHARLIKTFHTNGDWDGLKVDCINNGVHDKIAEDLRLLRAALHEAREACRRSSQPQAETDAKTGKPKVSMGGVACNSGLFDALLILVSDGRSTETLQGPQIWKSVQEVLAPSGTFASTAKAVASETARSRARPSTASAKGPEGPEVPAAEASSSGRGRVRIANSLPETQPIVQQQSIHAIEAQETADWTQQDEADPTKVPPERLSRRLNDLKSKVAWLSQEMAKLGEKGENASNAA